MRARLLEKYGSLSVVQFDAHADLRDAYEDNPYSHASVLARIRDLTPHTLHLGIRSMCREEADLAQQHAIPLFTMRQLRQHPEAAIAALQALPEPVFISFDVDAFDTGIVQNTGTPEPGGLSWDEALNWLERIFKNKRVVGCDVVELAPQPGDLNSPFAAAKLVYKMIGQQLAQKSIAAKEPPGRSTPPAGAQNLNHQPIRDRMPLTSYAELLQDARRGRYAVGAFNIFALEFLPAVLQAARENQAPVLLQINPIHFHLADLPAYLRYVKEQIARTAPGWTQPRPRQKL